MHETETIASAVRWTARVSATAFTAYQLVCGLAASAPRRGAARLPLWRRRSLAVLIGAHTVHFAAILGLAAASSGALAERGGWLVVLPVALLFYAAVLWQLGNESRAVAGRDLTRRRDRFRDCVVLGIWAGFFQAYASRVGGSLLFLAWLRS